MKLSILDKRTEGNATCFLCKINLSEYVNGIPDDYNEFEVQRGIVNNKYLDHLVETVAENLHIPPIVLIAESIQEKGNNLIIDNFRILDGLQRTHRLKMILDTLNFIHNTDDKAELRENVNKFSRKHTKELKAINSNSKLVKRLVELNGTDLKNPNDFFSDNTFWIEVWGGLSEEEQIRKMLLLNAGHKSVNIKHQLELLFLGTLVKLEDISPNEVSFVREKNQSAISYSKSRDLGRYHFSHLISSLIALSAGKLVNTNSDFISNIQAGSVKDIELIEGFDLDLLKVFIKFLFSLDMELKTKFGDVGVKWLGREVVLAGLFGAIGSFSKDNAIEVHELLKTLSNEVREIAEFLNLESFEKERNNVKLNKVNVGNVNRKAVYASFLDYMNKTVKSIDNWSCYFDGRGAS